MQISSKERLKLFQVIIALPGPQFDSIIFALNPPPGNIPPPSASRGDRTAALLEWLESPVGAGLETLNQILPELLRGDSAPSSENEAERRIQKALENNEVELNLSSLDLATIPESISQLKNLTKLSLSQNKLKSIPSQLCALTNLTWLSLFNNQITSICWEISQLTHLRELYLNHNDLKSVPKEVGQLARLAVLNLHQNDLALVPKEIGQLVSLKELDLHRNKLESIPKEIGEIASLEKLFLHQNRLNSVPQELGKLANLTELSLHQNRLNSIPQEIEQLPRLERLYLHDNNDLSLSEEILGPTWDEVDNGAIAANPKAILKYYFRSLLNSQPLNEAKLILVGFGSVGKTSLVNRLIHDRFDHDSRKTEGIQITHWPIFLNKNENVMLHLWDFGGQEIMHSTHQFFLTERSLYLLVLNGRQGHEDADAEYWLELIQSFGGDSPVVIVLNKIEEHSFDVNRRALNEKFPAIREFVKTDCELGLGIEDLRAIIERETDRLEHLRDSFPASWIGIKSQLVAMKDDYITFEKYRDICQEHGEFDLNSQDSLALYLRSLGIALNYKDDSRLRDTHILNPHWVTTGIYTLLNSPIIAETKGEFEASSLSQILSPQIYPPERHEFLLELMRKFELCFRFQEDENRYLFPDLLDKQQPSDATNFNLTECLNFRYEYSVLPEGLLPRFITRTHPLSDHQLRWRTGVILNLEGNQALVKADRQDRCVTVSVNGPFMSRRRLLAVIRADFERIHNGFKSKPKELVPVPGFPTITISYKELLIREKQGRTSLEVFVGDDNLLTLSVSDLLNGVDLEGTRQPTTAIDRHNQALRLFYSYSHKDETLRDELETHLKLLQRQGLIQPWYDRRILPGNDWASDIDDNLNRADIILLLISADFIASDYCYDLEMKRAMERNDSGEAIVIPIILRPTDWKNTPFSKLQFLPKNAEAVTQWGDRDAAWLNVETGIKRVVESIKGNRRL